MKNYAQYYQAITVSLRKSPLALKLLELLNGSVTKLMYLFYPLLLAYLAWKLPERLLIYILVPGISFVLVSLLRKLINQKRPYENWDLDPLIKKDTKGQSMPSRHVFSATIISVCFLSLNLYLGILLLIFSAILALCRVLGGVHYPKDVLVGMLLGILAGFLVFII